MFGVTMGSSTSIANPPSRQALLINSSPTRAKTAEDAKRVKHVTTDTEVILPLWD